MKKINYLFSMMLFAFINANATIQIVNVSNFAFTPSSFTINLGDTVKWVFVSGSHTTTSLVIPAGASAWNVPINSTSSTFIYKPSVAGTYNYQCNFHTSMQASFTVNGCPSVSGQIAASGATTFCKPASVTLNSFVTAGAVIQWQRNGTNITIGGIGSSYVATLSGSYRAIVSNNCGSTFTTNAISVVANSLPNVTITNGGDTLFKCAADSATLVATTTSAGTMSYQWFKGSAAISGATSNIYKTKITGSYKVVITKISTGCSKTSKITKVVNNCRQLNEMDTENISITLSPNPVSETVKVNFESTDRSVQIQIVNITGQQVYQKQISSDDNFFESSIDISTLPNGIYIMLVKSGSGFVSSRFVKE